MNMTRYVVVWFFIPLVACEYQNGDEKISLRWEPTEETLKYDAYIGSIDADTVPKIDCKSALENRALFTTEIDKLKTLPPFESSHLAALEYSEGFFNGEISRPLDFGEGDIRYQLELFGQFDDLGNSPSFYLPQKQKNLLNLFFDVPDIDVDFDTIWERNLYIIQIGQNFVPNSSRRAEVNRVLDVGESKDGSKIVAVGGVMYEDVEGYFEFADPDQSVPADYEYCYVFYGEFNVTNGYWQKNATLAYFGDFEAGKFEDISVYSITKK